MKFKADEVRLEVYRAAMRDSAKLREQCAARKAEREAEKSRRSAGIK